MLKLRALRRFRSIFIKPLAALIIIILLVLTINIIGATMIYLLKSPAYFSLLNISFQIRNLSREMIGTTESRGISHEIAVVTVIDDISSKEKYKTALKTIDCYCTYHSYKYTVIYAKQSTRWHSSCTQKNFLFRRHCIAANFIMESKQKYYLFIDGDMGVINPKPKIEDFLLAGKDVIFYNRLWGFEVMAGSYIVRKSHFAFNFLQNWANYDHNLNKFSDNVILHSAILDFATVNKSDCEEMLKMSRNFHEAFVYVACARKLMMEDGSWSKHIAILQKGTSWARDGWLTYSKWSPNDFMFHGWHEEWMNSVWLNPFVQSMSFEKDECKKSTQWHYDERLKRSAEEINYAVHRIISHVEQQFELALQDSQFFLENRSFPSELKFRILFAGLHQYPDFAAMFSTKNVTIVHSD